jgi:hypothetical protein
MSLATPESIERLHELLTKGKKHQRQGVASMIVELNLMPVDLETKSEKARKVPDLELRSIIFAVYG